MGLGAPLQTPPHNPPHYKTPGIIPSFHITHTYLILRDLILADLISSGTEPDVIGPNTIY